jgi:hypothetical protein
MFLTQLVGAFTVGLFIEVIKALLEDAMFSSLFPNFLITPKWRKPENQENPTIQQLRYLFYTSMFVAIQLHDVLREVPHGLTAQDKVLFFQQHIDLITPTIWFNITPGLRLIYVLAPRVMAYYF